MSRYLALTLLLCLDAFWSFPNDLSHISPLLTLNPGTKLVKCYLSLKMLKEILFLLPGREPAGREKGPVGGRRMEPLGWDVQTFLLTTHPVLPSRPNSEPAQPAHMGADGRGCPDLLLPVALRLRAGAPGAAPTPPTHPESVSDPSLHSEGQGPGLFPLTRHSVPVFPGGREGTEISSIPEHSSVFGLLEELGKLSARLEGQKVGAF